MLSRCSCLSRRNSMLLVVFLFPFFISWIIQNTSVPFACNDNSPMNDQVVMITGASSGIGQSLAIHYAESGASIIIVARRRSELEVTLNECLLRLNGDTNKVRHIVGDLSHMDTVDQIIETVRVHFNGKLNIAIMNHALVPAALLAEMEDWSNDIGHVLEVNTLSIIRLSNRLLPFLEQNDGKLVGIGSGGQYIPQLFLGAYSISKVALDTFFDHLRIEQIALGKRTSIIFIVLGEVATEQLLEKNRGQVYSASVIISPYQAASQIACVIQKNLSYSFVPSIVWFYSLIGVPHRALSPIISEKAFVDPKPDFRQRLYRARRKVLHRNEYDL